MGPNEDVTPATPSVGGQMPYHFGQTVGATRTLASITEAAMSAHRFERPLSPNDTYRDLHIEQGTLDVERLICQARDSARQRAHLACKKYASPVSPEAATDVATRILGLLAMSRYRRGPVQFVNEGQAVFVAKMTDAIREGRPIELILSFFGYKVQNPLKTWAREGTEVDISEMASLLRFYELTEGIRELYKPGAVFHVACDGRKYADAIGFTEEQGTGYYRNIRTMCEAMGIDHAVRVFEESDHYPADHKDRTAEHLERVKAAYAGGDVSMVQFVTKLQASMSLSSPIDASAIDLCQLRLAFSCMNDDELKAKEPRAWEIREHLARQSVDSSLKYIAVYDAVKEAGVIDSIAPAALRATVHPKAGQLGIYALNEHSSGIFPHHGQGKMGAKSDSLALEKIRMAFRADLERADDPVHAIALPSDKYPFSNGTHPFVVFH